MVATVPVWPPASVPWATIRSTPAACSLYARARRCRPGPLRRCRERAPAQSARVAGGSERAGHQPDRMPERDVQQRPGGLGRDAERSPAAGEAVGQGRHFVAVEQVSDELTVPVLGSAGRPRPGVASALAGAVRAERRRTWLTPSRSTPYGLPPVCSSIQVRSVSSPAGLCATAPSTPNPCTFVTAATTSRQWLKAKIGPRRSPSCSQSLGEHRYSSLPGGCGRAQDAARRCYNCQLTWPWSASGQIVTIFN